MKRTLAIVAALGLGLALLVWVLWPSPAVVGPVSAAPSAPAAKAAAPFRSVWDLLSETSPNLAMADAGTLVLKGQVTDPEGQPVPGAEVEVLPASGTPSVLSATCEVCGQNLLQCEGPDTGAEIARALRAGRGLPQPIAATTAGPDGTFSVEVKWDGALVVRAHDAQRRTGSVEASTDQSPDLELEVSIDKLVQINAQVTDEGGLPVAGATVLMVSTTDGAWAEATTDATGHFKAQCPSEPCALWTYVEAPGFAPQAQPGGQVDASDPELTFQLVKARDLDLLVRIAGQPVDAEVTIDFNAHPRKLHAAAGVLKLTGLGVYDLMLEATARGFTSGQRGVSVSQLHNRAVLDLRASARALVEVLDSDGKPVPNADVGLQGNDGRADAQTDEHGSLVVLGPVAEGPYQLSVRTEEGASEEREVDLMPGDNTISVTLRPVRAIKGRVVDADGKPTQSVRVTADFGRELQAASSDVETGEFVLLVNEAGPWELSAEHPLLGRAHLKTDAPAEGVVLKLDRKAGIRVRVTVKGEPADDLMVQLETEGTKVAGLRARLQAMSRDGLFRGQRRTLTTVTDDQGEARVWGLEPGPMTVKVDDGTYRPVERKVTLVEGQLAEVSLSLELGATIAGVVIDPRGRPVTDVQVIVTGGTGPGTRRFVGGRGVEEDGKFLITGLEPGASYDFLATSERGDSNSVTARAPAAGIKLTLVERPRVRGRVMDAAGKPLTEFEVDGATIDAADGRFEVTRSSNSEELSLYFTAFGYQGNAVEVPNGTDVGDVVMKAAKKIEGKVVSARGDPVPAALVSCDTCGETTTGADGAFELMLEDEEFPIVLRAARAGASGLVDYLGHGPAVIRLGPPSRIDGLAFDLEGNPSVGRVMARRRFGNENVFLPIDASGHFTGELAQGVWDFQAPEAETPRTVRVEGEVVRVALGGSPGTCALSVTFTPAPNFHVMLHTNNGRPISPPSGPTGMVLQGDPDEGEAHVSGLECGGYVVTASSPQMKELKPIQVELKGPVTHVALPAAP